MLTAVSDADATGCPDDVVSEWIESAGTRSLKLAVGSDSDSRFKREPDAKLTLGVLWPRSMQDQSLKIGRFTGAWLDVTSIQSLGLFERTGICPVCDHFCPM